MERTTRAAIGAATAAVLLLAGCSATPGDNGSNNNGADSDDPIRIGGTLALSGPLAATGTIHRIAGEQFVEWLNENGGLLDRPVEWVLLDDETNPQTSAAAYTRLIQQEEVDLLIGPYGTANITAAMEVAERNEMIFPHHSATLTYAYDYDWHFPLFASGRHSSETVPTTVFDAYESLGADAPQTVAFVVNENAATAFYAYGHESEKGAIELAEERGLDVVLELDYPQGNSDWAPIAQRVRDADPDLLWVGSLGGESPALLTALTQIGWEPRHNFHQFPAPGLLLNVGPVAEGATTLTMFEPVEPYIANEGSDVLVERFTAAAAAEGLEFTTPEMQAGLSWATWQVIVAGVEGAGSLDQEAIADYLLNNEVQTVIGGIKFDPSQNNYYGDFLHVKQIQDGDYYVVFPTEFATDGRSIR